MHSSYVEVTAAVMQGKQKRGLVVLNAPIHNNLSLAALRLSIFCKFEEKD